MVEMLLILIVGLTGIALIVDHFHNLEKIDKLERKLYKKR